MKIKRLIVPGVVAGLLAMGLTMPIGADNSITTTVTPLVLSVSVDQTSVQYGSLPLSPDNIDRSVGLSQVINATNHSSVTANLQIKGSDATPTDGNDSTWTLDCSPATTGTVGTDQYVHRFALGGSYDFVSNGKAMCPVAYTALASGLEANGAGMIDFKLQMNMPIASDGYSQRSSTVTVIAVAP